MDFHPYHPTQFSQTSHRNRVHQGLQATSNVEREPEGIGILADALFLSHSFPIQRYQSASPLQVPAAAAEPLNMGSEVLLVLVVLHLVLLHRVPVELLVLVVLHLVRPGTPSRVRVAL